MVPHDHINVHSYYLIKIKKKITTEKKNKLWYMYTMEYYAALKKDGDFTSFMFTWMELEHILLSKVSQEWNKK